MNLGKLIAASTLAMSAVSLATCAAKADVHCVVTGIWDDAGTLSGWFNIDQYGFLDSWDLTTTAGNTLPGYDYTPSSSVSNGGCTGNCIQLVPWSPDPPPWGTDSPGALNLALQNPLADGLPNPFVIATSGTWENGSWVAGGAPIRYLVSGTVSTPEASTWVMMAAGFAGLGFAAYRGGRKDPAFA